MAKLKITLVKSVIATKPNQRKTVTALAQIRGMIEGVKHLVKVEEA